ncbi:hypothetical protein FJ365_04545 [Candidatus Dependentiae bacterium]|nr:hypothetical protein [Candidatus Dependentiae bacterium]
MCTLKVLGSTVILMILVQAISASDIPKATTEIARVGKKRRKRKKIKPFVAELSPMAVLDGYASLSPSLRAFLKAQITARKDYSKQLRADFIYELLSYRDQLTSVPLQRLASLITAMELWESDLTTFAKLGQHKAHFTNLTTLRLFCSGLTEETFPDLSALPLTRLELWWCTIAPPPDKLPKTLKQIFSNGNIYPKAGGD